MAVQIIAFPVVARQHVVTGTGAWAYPESLHD